MHKLQCAILQKGTGKIFKLIVFDFWIEISLILFRYKLIRPVASASFSNVRLRFFCIQQHTLIVYYLIIYLYKITLLLGSNFYMRNLKYNWWKSMCVQFTIRATSQWNVWSLCLVVDIVHFFRQSQIYRRVWLVSLVYWAKQKYRRKIAKPSCGVVFLPPRLLNDLWDSSLWEVSVLFGGIKVMGPRLKAQEKLRKIGAKGGDKNKKVAWPRTREEQFWANTYIIHSL